jgi:hypothetical protein
MENDDNERERDRTAGESIFDPDGALSREFLLRRGECCRYGCKNCPYGFRGKPSAR